MENNEKAIFLTAPSGMFNSIEEAKKCGRALQAMLNYNYDNLNIAGNRILIGISNVDADIAHYESVKNGVGRPKRILQGDLENCFVDPHIHVLIFGDKAEKISSIVIDYLIKKSKKYGFDVGKLIWKEYPETDSDIARVEFYIERQSFSRLSVNRENVGNQNDEMQVDDVIKSDDALFFESFGECDVSEKLDLFEYLEDSKVVTEGGANAEFEQDLFNFNSISCADKNIRNTVVQMDVDYFIADLRTKWRYLQQMKKIAVELIATAIPLKMNNIRMQ